MKKRENVKVGETYYVRTKVLSIDVEYTDTEIAAAVVDEKGKSLGPDVIYFSGSDLAAFSLCKQETAPKYDPNRYFRKGDRVKLKEEINGRRMSDFVTSLSLGKIYTVKEDEDNCTVLIDSDNGLYRYSFMHLQLVTPVEEQEPYSVSLRQELTVDDTYPYCAVIDYDGNEVARFYCEQYEEGKARAAAEAERDRLNAEYRKENA